jgi:hypothetical protein
VRPRLKATRQQILAVIPDYRDGLDPWLDDEYDGDFEMENRGTGLTPQRLPAEWMKSKLDMTSQPDQGPSKDMAPTSRALIGGTSFMDAAIRSRPGSLYGESRSQAPVPTEIIDVLNDAPGAFITQTIVGGSFDAEADDGGGPGNVSVPINDVDFARGSATRTTGKPVIGKTLAKGTI